MPVASRRGPIRVPEPVVSSPDSELHAHVERALTATYELDREIGRGGMGIVYRARDRRLKRTVAVKVLPPELAFRSEIRTRFLREAETAAQLSHPNIVPIYSVGEAENFVFFVMACVEGENLGKRLHDRGPLPVDDVRRILIEVANALAYAHARGVVHRDIKPDNILLDSEGDRALVTDFGIARAVIEGSDSRLTATGMAIGTPAYMSPEQSAGEREVDGRSDLYSLGIVAYQMLAGALPFTASSTPAMLIKHLSERPVPVSERRPDVPPDLADTVMRLLEKEPADRQASAAELADALERRVPPPALTGAATRPSASSSQPATRDGHVATYRGQVVTDLFEPTEIERARWEDTRVKEFRGQGKKYLVVNVVILICAIFFDTNFLAFTAFWSVFMAFKYAKLWSDGFDWRDVFEQPRDRLLFDVMAETCDDTVALFDKDRRAELRAKSRRRVSQGGRGMLGAGSPASTGAATAPGAQGRTAEELARLAGPYMAAVRQAVADRDEILRVLSTMPKAERERIAEVGPSANALATKIQDLAVSVAELERSADPDAAQPIEQEIARLEGEANPLDRSASDGRVKRLAYLKRQRRAVSDVTRRRDAAAAKLESCRIALQNMRLDVVRLRAGGGLSHLQVTSVAEQAMALAREVDHMVFAADEVARASAGSRSRG
jgi:serine/threonine protein kinase